MPVWYSHRRWLALARRLVAGLLTAMSWRLLYRNHDLRGRCWRWLPAVAWVLVLACLSVEILVRSDVVWRFAPASAVPAVLSVRHDDGRVQEAERDALHAEVLAFYYGARPLAHPIWQAHERAHLADVKIVLDRIRLFGLVLGGVLLALSLWRWERGWWLRRCGVLTTGLLVGVGLLMVQWTAFSRILHPLVFPQGNWDFLLGRDVIIALYPQSLLAVYAVAIVVLFAVLGLGAWVVGRLLTGEPVAASWTWSRAQRWLPVVALAGIYPAWWLGRRSFADWDPGYWAWYGLSAVLVMAVIAVLARRDRAWPVLVLVMVSCLWWGHMLGLRSTVHAAAATVREGGAEIQAAIEAYLDRYGRPPPTLAACFVGDSDRIPPVRGGRGTWYYTVGRRLGRGRRAWYLGFHGPLGFMHEYSSVRGTWNTLPWQGLL